MLPPVTTHLIAYVCPPWRGVPRSLHVLLAAFLVYIACALDVVGGEPDASATRLSPTAQAAMERADTDITKIEADAADRVVKVRQVLITALTKAQTEATKKGDLDLALTLKQAIQDQQAKVAATTSGSGAGQPAAGSGSGIKVTADGHPDLWDNQGPYQMSTSPHLLSAYLKLPGPIKSIVLRAKPGYGCERIIWTMDGQGESHMAREYTFTFKTAKDVVRLDGNHAGSNDSFAYGPLQYRIAPDGEWQEIPATQLAPK